MKKNRTEVSGQQATLGELSWSAHILGIWDEGASLVNVGPRKAFDSQIAEIAPGLFLFSE